LIILLAAPVKSQTGNSNGTLSVSYTWTRIPTHGSNQIAIWVEDTSGNFIVTVFATQFTASGGYEKRPVSLSVWAEKSGLAAAPKEEVDAVSGSTPVSGKQTVIWNCTDKSGKAVSPGVYVIRMEANIKNEHKMFFTGEIKIGDTEQQAIGEISIEGSEPSTGEVLFQDVQLTYKP
jgi:hypothetical protein